MKKKLGESRITVRFPEETLKKIEKLANKNGLTSSSFIRMIVTQFLNKKVK